MLQGGWKGSVNETVLAAGSGPSPVDVFGSGAHAKASRGAQLLGHAPAAAAALRMHCLRWMRQPGWLGWSAFTRDTAVLRSQPQVPGDVTSSLWLSTQDTFAAPITGVPSWQHEMYTSNTGIRLKPGARIHVIVQYERLATDAVCHAWHNMPLLVSFERGLRLVCLLQHLTGL